MYIRVVKLSGKYHGLRVNLNSDISNIKQFADEGTPSIIVADLEDLEAFGINPKDVQMQ